jgi:hypothetical protein
MTEAETFSVVVRGFVLGLFGMVVAGIRRRRPIWSEKFKGTRTGWLVDHMATVALSLWGALVLFALTHGR